MKAGSFITVVLLASCVSDMTPAGVFPTNPENMTNFYDTSSLATNGVNVAKANTTVAPIVALDKQINGTTFALIMFDPNTFVTASKLKVISSDFFSVTGV